MKDRLLSTDEIYGEIATIKTDSIRGVMVPLLKAQLAKTDKEWVEWIENNFNRLLTKSCTDCRKYIGTPTCARRHCSWKLWQERKKGLEAKQ